MKKSTSSSMFYVYLLYALIVTVLALYFRFPAEKFKAYCEQRVEHFFENTNCTIADISYDFPRTMTWNKVVIYRQVESFASRLAVDRLTVKPGWAFWKNFTLAAELYSGKANAKLNISYKDENYILKDIEITGIEISTLNTDQKLSGREVSGTLDASGKFQAKFISPTAGEGKFRFTLSSGKYELLQPILSLPTIDFDKINFDLTAGEQMDIQQGKLKGTDLNAEFSGNIDPAPSFPNSRLKFTGLIEPQAEFLSAHPQQERMVKQYARRYKRSALPFILGGSVSNPTFRFSR